MTISTRAATSDDLEFLTLALLETANWDGLGRMTVDELKKRPDFWHYLDGWMRDTDFGVIAFDADEAVGAGWARTLPDDDRGYGFVSADIPELGMAVTEQRRGRGVGRIVLERLIVAARERDVPGLSLSVEDGNSRARSLYLSLGFEVVGRNGNSDTLLRRF